MAEEEALEATQRVEDTPQAVVGVTEDIMQAQRRARVAAAQQQEVRQEQVCLDLPNIGTSMHNYFPGAPAAP